MIVQLTACCVIANTCILTGDPVSMSTHTTMSITGTACAEREAYYDCDRETFASKIHPIHPDYELMCTNTDVSLIIERLGTVYDYNNKDNELIIGVEALGYIYFPADYAYRALLSLKIDYCSLWRLYLKSLDRGNRLRTILLARAIAVQYPNDFSRDLQNLLCSESDKGRIVMLIRCAYEAFTLTMHILPSNINTTRWDEASATLFGNGVRFFSDTNVARFVDGYEVDITREMRMVFPLPEGENSLARRFISQIHRAEQLWSNDMIRASITNRNHQTGTNIRYRIE